MTIIGVILLDFDCDACQSPARAYLIDVSRVEDHSLGLSMFTVMAGAGGCIGYALGGIPWASLFSSNSNTTPTKTWLNFSNSSSNDTIAVDNDSNDLAYEHKQILFTMVAVIFVICVFICITSFKEIPLDMVDKPMTMVTVTAKSSNMKYNRMEEENDEFTFDFERSIGDDIDTISVDRIEFKHEKLKMTKMEAIKE